MITGKKRIYSLKANLGHIEKGQKIIVGIELNTNHKNKLMKIGFPENLKIGDSLLPKPIGPVSRFNADGNYLIHKDQPMETAYRTRVWRWTEWHGKKRVEQSKIVDVPYQRYPRTFIKPPSIELKISEAPNGNIILAGPITEYDGNGVALLHIINLFLEIFHECQFFTKELDTIIKGPIRKLNWDILPKGRMPWVELNKHLKPIINGAKKGNRQMMEYRFRVISNYNPDFTAVGKGGFIGYVVFGFENKGLYLFESAYHGNATYVFDNEWEELSKKTKAEILDYNLQRDRIIHRTGWQSKIKNLLE